MFTGLIQDVGKVEQVEAGADGARMRIATQLGAEIEAGDSVAVNGVCLTATKVDASGFEIESMNQTLETTAIGELESGDLVNLELAMRASDRLGGHIVQGHVDGVGEISGMGVVGFSYFLHVTLPPELLRYVVEKGSIALDGVSLTVAHVRPDGVEVSLIPETLRRTTLGVPEAGRKLNVECDVVAKYVERLVSPFGGKEPA